MIFKATKVIKFFITLFIILMLGGCVGRNMLPTLSEKNHPKEKEGVVVVRVINASAYPLPFNQLAIAPRNLNESKKIKPSRLQSLPVSTTSSTIFSSPVKAGSYSLYDIRSFYTKGDYWYLSKVESDVQFGTFNVNPSQVTDLGTIIYYSKPVQDKHINTLLRRPAQEKGKILQEYFPFYLFNNEDVATWSEDEYQEQRFELYASIAQNPVTFNEKYLAPDNTMYFIGKLGVILSRTPEGDWEIDAVESDLNLSAIVKSTAGDLVVGGDEGTIFYKPNGGDWKNISIDNSHHIEDFYFNSDKNLTVITRQESKVHVMYLDNVDAEWQTKTMYTYNNGWLNNRPEADAITNEKENNAIKFKVSTKLTKSKPQPKRIVSAELSYFQGTHIIEIKYQYMYDDFVLGSYDIEKYSYNPVSWQVSPYSHDLAIDKIINAGSVKVGIDYDGSWSKTGKLTYYKPDNASKKWREIRTKVLKCNTKVRHLKNGVCVKEGSKKGTRARRESFTFNSIPWFSNDIHGLAIVDFSGKGEHSGETKIVETFDGGKTWQITENKLPNNLCTQIIGEVKDSVLLSCNGFSSDFYESIDNAKSWELVREQENF